MTATKASARDVSTAVIVAAGLGSRLRDADGVPKPLRPVLGVPLIRRVMATAAKAGIRRFTVVIGHQAERMRAELPGLVPKGCKLDLVENPRFEEPNGVSLLAASRALREPFALLMADHLFSADRLAAARQHFRETGRALLVVEGRDSFRGDLDDATRVAVRDGRVTAIAKDLARFEAIDTGMFLLEPAAVTAALEAAGPSPSISDGMRRLTNRGELDALLLDHGWWQDVDTPDDVAVARQKLFHSLSKPTDGFLARRINRRISLAISSRLWNSGITPNMATTFTLLPGLGAGLAFAQGPEAGWGLLGAFLFQAQSILDGVDGELARLLHKESRFGYWYDVSVDNLTHMGVFGGIAAGQAAGGAPGPWTLLGILAVLGVTASMAVTVPVLDPGRRLPLGRRRKKSLQKLLEMVSQRDFTYFLFPLALLGWLGGFLWAAAVGSWIYALLVLALRARQNGRNRNGPQRG